MAHPNKTLSVLLQGLDLGSSVAELDTLLEAARIETSALTDLLNDRVDLVPGTKGSGKSALFRIFVDFLPDILLRDRKVVVAHGIQAPGDPVFHTFTDRFSKLSEEEFVSFWCIYLVSLAHEQFIKGARYREFLQDASVQIDKFRLACANAKIPEIQAKKSLRDILEWSLHVLAGWRPKLWPAHKIAKPEDPGTLEEKRMWMSAVGAQAIPRRSIHTFSLQSGTFRAPTVPPQDRGSEQTPLACRYSLAVIRGW